ncbi:hypothetical protein JCM16418A_11530 [Paenibacillus pini]|uniref:Uncharacterized protein n=1 Tax=Paenibacillus pini JCM 16418 TaxID=1236976 RepID=W7Y9X3_9BACL|nr:hypothetical protein JCM16418_1866 [Paenibacillus pini JCM 16418]
MRTLSLPFVMTTATENEQTYDNDEHGSKFIFSHHSLLYYRFILVVNLIKSSIRHGLM